MRGTRDLVRDSDQLGGWNLSPYHRYLSLLGVESAPPSLAHLRRLVRAQIERVPFENISKLYYLRTRGMRDVPDLELYLDGIERHRFGGTCYSNNPYLYGLLRFLGYDVSLCGADMSEPDVHTALQVRLEGREYHVDAGYGAPFLEPLPRDVDHDVDVALGNERWVLKPRDDQGRSRVEHHRDGKRIHGYLAKPQPREPEFFGQIIADSYRPDATFMNAIRVVRFHEGGSVSVSNLNLVRAAGTSWTVTRLPDADALVDAIEEHFGIAPVLTREAIAAAGTLRDVYAT